MCFQLIKVSKQQEIKKKLVDISESGKHSLLALIQKVNKIIPSYSSGQCYHWLIWSDGVSGTTCMTF